MRVANLLVTLAVIGALMSLGSLLSRHHMILDIGAHFRLQYIVLLVPALLLALVGKRLIAAFLLFAVVVVHGYTVGASLRPVAVEQTGYFADLRVFSVNLLFCNKNYQEFLALVTKLQPDVLALQEYTPQWHKVLSGELVEYPHRVTQPLHGGFGIALYSRHAIAAGGLSNLGNGGKPSVDVALSVDDKSIRLINVHPPPPSNSAFYEERNALMADLALATGPHDAGATVVVGDFNSTPWSGHFSDMESASGLRSARRGIGIAASWPDSVPPLLIPIDHMLVSNSIDVRSFKSVPVTGSDHRGIAGDLRIYFPE